MEQDCGNCDICLNPPQTYDATEDARKALSCVYRVGQRFGVGHVIDVLRGSHNQRILDLRHDQLSTYGLGAEKSPAEWGSLFRQLVHLGFLRQDLAGYSVLKLTERARPLLRGEEPLYLARPRLVRGVKKPAARRKIGDFDYDDELFNMLRAVRKRMAEEAGVPPFVVFADVSLAEMAARRPLNREALLQISGVGAHKAAHYGGEFIEAIIGYMAR